MAKYNDVIYFRDATSVRNEEGVVSIAYEETGPVFFNRYSISLQNRMAGAAEGLRGMVSGQVRTIDYGGQELAVLDGIEYGVDDASNDGEFTVLTLSRRLSNG